MADSQLEVMSVMIQLLKEMTIAERSSHDTAAQANCIIYTSDTSYFWEKCVGKHMIQLTSTHLHTHQLENNTICIRFCLLCSSLHLPMQNLAGSQLQQLILSQKH